MKLFFGFVLTAMLGVTVWASLDQNVIEGFKYLFQNRWGIATLCDTYFSFTIIYLWIAYREASWFQRALWLLLVYSLGSIAVSFYFFIQYYKIKKRSDQNSKITFEQLWVNLK